MSWIPVESIGRLGQDGAMADEVKTAGGASKRKWTKRQEETKSCMSHSSGFDGHRLHSRWPGTASSFDSTVQASAGFQDHILVVAQA